MKDLRITGTIHEVRRSRTSETLVLVLEAESSDGVESGGSLHSVTGLTQEQVAGVTVGARYSLTLMCLED